MRQLVFFKICGPGLKIFTNPPRAAAVPKQRTHGGAFLCQASVCVSRPERGLLSLTRLSMGH